MIKRIDIPNFGSFKEFVWSHSVFDSDGNANDFKKLNILYGRNYSGKTTLSRILRCFQTGELPEKYESPSFSITTSTEILTQAQITTSNLGIRVYNKDFVDEHLSFLRDNNGDITAFAILGSENKKIEEEIEEKKKQLGSIEKRSGLHYAFDNKQQEYRVSQQKMKTAGNELERKLFNKANTPPGGIKHNPLYKNVNYDTRNIKTDIQTIRANSIRVLSNEERKQEEALLDEKPIQDIDMRGLKFTPSISSLHKDAEILLTKEIAPSKPIQELLDDADLQAWVKEGINHHKGRRTSCGFCGAPLSNELWEKLDAHFNEASAELEKALHRHMQKVEKEKEIVANTSIPDTNAFYSVFHDSYSPVKRQLEVELDRYQKLLDDIIENLHKRLNNIFSPCSPTTLADNSDKIIKRIDAIKELVEQNNKKTRTLEEDQNNAREDLRLSEIALFMQEINYEEEEEKIRKQKEETNGLKQEVDNLQRKISKIEEAINKLQVQLKDEKKGADKVNDYLNRFFGHAGLSLEAVEDAETSTYKFNIMRGDLPAYNLSEGECSLVSFCYFIAKLDEPESSGKNLIICIDDPVSSLDSNHIFFLFALIESVIAAPMRYEQLFLLTHNLEFLKYLKRLSRPRKDCEHFLVVCSEGKSTIKLMPDYLRKYITEFNYLFGEIYTCVNQDNESNAYHCFYNFGNNLRKFLEVYLFFKYPFSDDNKDHESRIRRFFEDEQPESKVIVERLTNEYSHLSGVIDRSTQPIDHAEISKTAEFVLKIIKQKDPDQFQCLVDSIRMPDPFE